MNTRALIQSFAGIGAILKVERFLHLGGPKVPTQYELTLIQDWSQTFFWLRLHEGRPASLVVTWTEIRSESPSIRLQMISAQSAYSAAFICGKGADGWFLRPHEVKGRCIPLYR
ncbi:MAG: hypothetical protein AAF587_35420 [Bacteroidota bacterium]